ncbi:MAG TPA: alpha/beta hydrolase [Candidatus Dormibacteraeota bacterium]|nr:alpha/beta hydrolase [Candidatus Dormibacteraeota bacterium]
MSLDPEARTYLEATAALGLPSLREQGAKAARLNLALRAAVLAGPVEDVARVEDVHVPGPAGPIPVRLHASEATSPLPLVVYFHGGGWVTGDLDTHDPVGRALANRSGCLVASVDFRSAPEHPFPAPLDDCWAVVEWLAALGAEVGGDPSRIAVFGDSAGGNLAAAVSLRARDRGGPSLAAQVLVFPVLDHDLNRPSYRANGTGFGLTRDSMAWYWEQYLLGGADPNSPELSPLRASDLSGLPPALVITAEFDPLVDEGVEYARRLAEAGVPVEHLNEAGMIHGYLRMGGVMSRAGKTLDDCARFLGGRLG